MKKCMVKDIRRSTSLFLVFVLLLCIFSTIGANAADEGDGLILQDNGKSIGIFSDLNSSSIGFKPKYISIYDTEGIILPNSYDVEITVDVSIEDSEGKEIKVISYESSEVYAYGSYGVWSKDYSVFKLRPVFYDDDGDKIEYGYDNSEIYIDEYAYNDGYTVVQDSSETNGIFGLHPDFKKYMTDIFPQEKIDTQKVIDFLSSDENRGKIHVSYKFTNADNNIFTLPYYDYSIYYCDAKKVDMYVTAYAYRLNYSRIEDMTDYHNNNEFDDIKMYRGDLYVDADKIGSDSTIILPNYNKTGLFNMKSLYVDDNIIYSDNDYSITMEEWYSIVGNTYNNYTKIFPDGFIKNYDDAWYYLMKLCYSEYDSDDSQSKFEEFINGLGLSVSDYTDNSYEYAVSSWEAFDYYPPKLALYDNGKQYILTLGHNSNFKLESFISTEASDISYEQWGELGDTVWMSSLYLPDIDLTNTYQEGTLKENLTKYRNYLEFLEYTGFTNEINYGYESLMNMYNYIGKFKNTDKETSYTIYEVIDILNTIITYMDGTNSDILDYDILGEDFKDLIGFRSASDGLNLNGYTTDQYNIENYFINLPDIYGIQRPEIKVYALKDEAYDIPTAFESVEKLISYLDNNNLLTGYKEQIMQKGYIKYECNATVEKFTEPINNSVRIDNEYIHIPAELLNNSLGKDNIISQYYYMVDSDYGYMYEFKDTYTSDCEGTMLYYGTEKPYCYNLYASINLNDNSYLKRYIIPYSAKDALYYNELTNLKFAKVPGIVDVSNEIYQTEKQNFTLTWKKPEDNGAEIIGYQVAVVPKGTKVTEENFYTLSNLTYKDVGDNYVIPYTTDDLEYSLSVGNISKDVYIRAVNVIGPGPIKKITVNYEYDFEIVGPDYVYTATTTDYDSVDVNDKNIENYVTYSLKGNPDKVYIDSYGNLTVDRDCELDSVVIISVGNKETRYEGITAEKEVLIIKSEETTTEPETTSEPEDSSEDVTGGNPPQTGDETNINKYFVFEVLSGVALIGAFVILRKRKED